MRHVQSRGRLCVIIHKYLPVHIQVHTSVFLFTPCNKTLHMMGNRFIRHTNVIRISQRAVCMQVDINTDSKKRKEKKVSN